MVVTAGYWSCTQGMVHIYKQYNLIRIWALFVTSVSIKTNLLLITIMDGQRKCLISPSVNNHAFVPIVLFTHNIYGCVCVKCQKWIVFYRSRRKYDGRLCFHRYLLVARDWWGYPLVKSKGLSPSYFTGAIQSPVPDSVWGYLPDRTGVALQDAGLDGHTPRHHRQYVTGLFLCPYLVLSVFQETFQEYRIGTSSDGNPGPSLLLISLQFN